MKTLYSVSFVFQNPSNYATVQSLTVVFEGISGWDREQVLSNARLEISKQCLKVNEGFRETVASYSVTEIGFNV